MVLAASNNPWEYLENWNLLTPEDRPLYQVGDFLGLFLNIIFGSAVAISVIALIVSGIKFITARADPKGKAAAQQALTYSVVGFILAIGAFTVKTIIFNVLGGGFRGLLNPTPNF